MSSYSGINGEQLRLQVDPMEILPLAKEGNFEMIDVLLDAHDSLYVRRKRGDGSLLSSVMASKSKEDRSFKFLEK